jgi:hypothetical protein
MVVLPIIVVTYPMEIGLSFTVSWLADSADFTPLVRPPVVYNIGCPCNWADPFCLKQGFDLPHFHGTGQCCRMWAFGGFLSGSFVSSSLSSSWLGFTYEAGPIDRVVGVGLSLS